MPKPSQADVRYFAELDCCTAAATAILGREFRDPPEAASALAELAADRSALGEVLAALPGGALAALRVVSEAARPLAEIEITSALEVEVGKDRGRAAFQALLGRGFLSVLEQGFPRFELWKPLRAPIREALAGVDLVPGPEVAAGIAPDCAALAIALLLGHLWRTRPKVTRDGALFKKDAAELDRLFQPALGAGVAERFVHVFHAMHLLGLESTGAERSSFRFAAADEPSAFLGKPRAERVRAFAVADLLPRWISAAFAAGQNLVSREGLRRAAGRYQESQGLPAAADTWIGYCVAAGILDELPGGLRVSAELRGLPAPERPSSGKWLVQPNLEVVVPPDVPHADAFRLACFAEIGSLDRAAVLRITQESLVQAAEGGVAAEEIVGRLAARAGAPLPDLVVRSVREGARVRPAAWIHTGTVIVVPEAAREPLRSRIDPYAHEIAPGVFLVQEGAESRVRKALSSVDLAVRQPSTRFDALGTDTPEYGAREIRELLEVPCVAPADARLARAIAAARAGDAVAFGRPARPVVNPPSVQAAGGGGGPDLDGLLDEVLERLERGATLHPERIPAAERQLFMGRLGRVLHGRTNPERFGPAFVRSLERLLGRPPGSNVEPGIPHVPAIEGGNGTAETSGERGATPPLDTAWEPATVRAIAERLDLWIGLAGERRPRLVTPHRVVRRQDGADLLALTHDSGDLRVFPGARITGAAPGGPSADVHLPGAGPDRPALRAARNEACPCGSGRKYKTCCLPADLAAAAG